MLKYVLFAAIVASTTASAQDARPNVTKPATGEKVKATQTDEQYCVYEDKKYTEGAVKKADGVVMICMRESGFSTVSYNGGPSTFQPLVWEPATSAKGRERLNLKSSSDVFK